MKDPAAKALTGDIYMDDILTGADTIEEARALQRQLSDLCMAGGFPLQKWSANEPFLLNEVPAEHRMQRESLSWQALESHPTLGLQWHPSRDAFFFTTRAISVSKFTKRSVLSLTARLFDPLGWLAPAVVRAKILFQSTWLQGIGWDTLLDDDNARLWRVFQESLPELERIQIPRHLPLRPTGSVSQLHGFADASERAYAAVIYLRTEPDDGPAHVELVTAKTKVAPLRQVTLPRLELSAAALLARLMSHIRATLGAKEAPVHLWSDSTVANRVADIQTTLPDAQWHHIPGQDNPADCASRGLSPSELPAHPLWWRGPDWLRQDTATWPAAPGTDPAEELPEARLRAHAAVVLPEVEEPDELTRFSSLTRLIRVTAWCQRWLHRRDMPQSTPPAVNEEPPAGPLTAAEYERALHLWIRRVQRAHYNREFEAAKRMESIKGRSALTKLTPFVDSQNLLRVGGRLASLKAPANTARAIASHPTRGRSVPPQDDAWRSAAYSRCHSTAILDSEGPIHR